MISETRYQKMCGDIVDAPDLKRCGPIWLKAFLALKNAQRKERAKIPYGGKAPYTPVMAQCLDDLGPVERFPY